MAVSDTCALLNFDVAVDVMLPTVIFEVNDSIDPARERRDFLDMGDNETFAIGTKIPCFAGHSKYLKMSQ